MKKATDPLSFLPMTQSFTPIFRKLLTKRGFLDDAAIETFLSSDLSQLHDPFLMKNMREVKERIELAVKEKQKILLHGDYDADGITGVAVMAKTLTKFTADFDTFLPERERHGYGVSEEAIRKAHQTNAKLIITIDCGITAKEEIRLARELGMDVIVIDHHRLPADGLPETHLILNPLQKDCLYPFKELSAAGLVFKLAQAMIGKEAFQFLDLVALSTVCDVAPLVFENRILVRHGFEELSKRTNLGLKCLGEVAKLKSQKVDTGHVGFILGPRINAAGRMSSPDTALQLLLTGSQREAVSLANILNAENKARQQSERAITKEVIGKVERTVNFNKERVIVVGGQDWHQGVIGIVASRLVEKYYRPAIVISIEEGTGKGSGRSIKGFHLFHAIEDSAALLEEFGGHEQAAGLSIKEGNIAAFKEKINEYARVHLNPEIMIRKIPVDLEISLGELTSAFIRELELLEPFGVGNPRPVFRTKGLRAKTKARLVYGETYELVLTDGASNFTALITEKHLYPFTTARAEAKFDVAFTIKTKFWNGMETLTLDVKDVRLLEDLSSVA